MLTEEEANKTIQEMFIPAIAALGNGWRVGVAGDEKVKFVPFAFAHGKQKRAFLLSVRHYDGMIEVLPKYPKYADGTTYRPDKSVKIYVKAISAMHLARRIKRVFLPAYEKAYLEAVEKIRRTDEAKAIMASKLYALANALGKLPTIEEKKQGKIVRVWPDMDITAMPEPIGGASIQARGLPLAIATMVIEALTIFREGGSINIQTKPKEDICPKA